MRSQKKQTDAARAAWRLAVNEGRVLRYVGTSRMTAFVSVEARQSEEARCKRAGVAVEVVRDPASDLAGWPVRRG